MHVSKVNVGRPHGIETSQRRTKLGEGSSSQSECDVRFRSEADIEVLSPDVRFTPKADIAKHDVVESDTNSERCRLLDG
jgi:hypothetical protein